MTIHDHLRLVRDFSYRHTQSPPNSWHSRTDQNSASPDSSALHLPFAGWPLDIPSRAANLHKRHLDGRGEGNGADESWES